MCLTFLIIPKQITIKSFVGFFTKLFSMFQCPQNILLHILEKNLINLFSTQTDDSPPFNFYDFHSCDLYILVSYKRRELFKSLLWYRCMAEPATTYIV